VSKLKTMEENMSNTDLQVKIKQVESQLAEIPGKTAKWANKMKWIAGLGVCILISPFVLMGIGGLVGGMTFIIIAYAASQFVPYFVSKISNKKKEMMLAEANRHLAALKAEARKNPVETMQNVYREQALVLKDRADKIQKFATKVNKYGMQLKDLKAKFPGDASSFDQVHADMTLLLKKRQEKWVEASDKHKQSASEIERCQAIWEMSQATLDLRESAGDVETEFLQKIRTDTAIDAVRDSLASSMADLDALLMEEVPLRPVEKQAIANSTPLTLESNISTVSPKMVAQAERSTIVR